MAKFFVLLLLALIGVGVYGYYNNPVLCRKLSTEIVTDLPTILTPGSGSASSTAPASETTTPASVDSAPLPKHWKQGFVTGQDTPANPPAPAPTPAPEPSASVEMNRVYPQSDYSDYNEALEASRARNRPMVILFTGSDWCPYCQDLEHEVLSTSEFEQYKNSHFVFLTVDDLRNSLVSDGDKQRVTALESRFRVSGFPTMVVIADDEKELGRTTGYNPGSGPTAVIGDLSKYLAK